MESTELLIDNPRGTRDLHPYQTKLRRQTLNKIRAIIEKHGAYEIDTPALERYDILFNKYGENNKLVYELTNTGQKLALRYDLTVPLARYVVQHDIYKLKRYHEGKVWRRDNPSPSQGRFCEFTQFDFDIVGTGDSMLQDAEVLSVMTEVLDTLNIGKYSIKISHRGLLALLMNFCGVPSDMFATTCSSIDKLDKLAWEQVEEELIQKKIEKKVIDELKKYMIVHGDCFETEQYLRKIFEEHKEINVILDNLNLLFKYLRSLNCIDRFEFNLSLARGLDYYTGIIFEATLLENKDLNVGSIAAGGRYDNLISSLNSKKIQIPCIGCSFGIERIFTVLESKKNKEDKNISETLVLVHPIGKDMIFEALAICKELWTNDIKTEFMPYKQPKMKDQIEYCLNNKIKYMIIIGETEFSKGLITIKDTTTKTQKTVSRKDYLELLKI